MLISTYLVKAAVTQLAAPEVDRNVAVGECQMPIQPYLMFNGRCEEAIEFYKKALGARPPSLVAAVQGGAGPDA